MMKCDIEHCKDNIFFQKRKLKAAKKQKTAASVATATVFVFFIFGEVMLT